MKTVLLVEDNEDDIFLMKKACHRTGIPHVLRVVTDGDMAIHYLSGKGAYADRTAQPMPDVVFLDIKMPKRDGHEVLKWIRALTRHRKTRHHADRLHLMTADMNYAC